MELILTDLSRYVIALLMGMYTYWGFMGFAAKKKTRNRIIRRQRSLMYLFHFVGHGVIYLNTGDVKILGIYICELAYFVGSQILFQKIFSEENMPLVTQIHMLFSISLSMLVRLDFDIAKRQFVYMIIGTVLAAGMPWLLKHMKNLSTDGWFYSVLGVIMLLLVMMFGTTKYGAKNWLIIGGVSLQLSEFVKVLFVLSFAGLFATESLAFKSILKMSAMAAAFVGVLVLEKDLGGALIFFICYLFMLFVATGKWSYLLEGFLAGTGASMVAYFLFGHVRTRVLAWRDPWGTIDNQGYQVAQSLFAIGTGGWFGMGLTAGLPKTVPIRESDFIFAVISEEMGAVFAICIILIYLCCFIWMINIAMRVNDMFGKYLVVGYSVILLFQTFLTLGGVTKFIPSTGVTLPLVSYGGSSVLGTMIMFGVLMGVNVNEQRMVNDNAGQVAEETKD
ncbi:MAG: FtsW/RodA/SpoVE family cell cycle protein [Lachnospiraceae bacterium]|nr:FtsW/RodA/SpoVE family cell cycle protein [Lachnospiraceae bacterium]